MATITLMEAIVLGNGTKKYQEIVQILKDGGANLQIPITTAARRFRMPKGLALLK